MICPICDKTIRRFQANAQCSICDLYIHLSCLGSEFEQSKHCSLCSVPVLSPNNSVGSTFPLLPDLANLVTNRGLKIVHQNIQSLTKKIDELRLICSSVQAGIHLLTLSETWLNEQISDSEISIEGYKIFRLDRADRGGGVAVYVKSELSLVRRDDLEIDGVEGLWLELFLPKSRGILIGTLYRPPNSSRFNDKEFISKFEIMLDTATADGKEIILLGDFNYDFLRSTPGSDACSIKRLKLLFRLLNFRQCIVDATRIAQRSASLLDIVVTNTPKNFSCTGVISTGLSDHELVYCVRKIN